MERVTDSKNAHKNCVRLKSSGNRVNWQFQAILLDPFFLNFSLVVFTFMFE